MRLRAANALTVSLVATGEEDRIIGQAARSPIHWDGGDGWFGLGPASVGPDRQRQGVGSALAFCHAAGSGTVRYHSAFG